MYVYIKSLNSDTQNGVMKDSKFQKHLGKAPKTFNKWSNITKQNAWPYWHPKRDSPCASP